MISPQVQHASLNPHHTLRRTRANTRISALTQRGTLAAGETLLQVTDLSLRFGGVKALTDINLDVTAGKIHAIIGPNGAGKSSLLNCISGLYRPSEGRIVLRRRAKDDEQIEERVISRLPPHRIARFGVARTFQNIELFDQLSVLDNIMLGRHIHIKKDPFIAMLWFGPAKRQEIHNREFVEEVIDLLKLQQYRNQPVGSLSYGIQKRVELGRALAMQPALLLLDEPMAGMNVEEKEDMVRYILDIHELAGVSVVLIEHDMGVVMDISNRVTVLDFGKIIGDGTPAEVMQNAQVVEAYLGAGQQA